MICHYRNGKLLRCSKNKKIFKRGKCRYCGADIGAPQGEFFMDFISSRMRRIFSHV